MGMTNFEKLAVRLRARPVSVALLLVTVLLLFMLFVTQYSNDGADEQARLEQVGQSLLQAKQSRLENQITLYRDWLTAIISWQGTQDLLSNQQADIRQWQQTLKTLVPGLQHACVFEQAPLTPESDCIPMTYVSLDIMRSLDSSEPSDLVLINKASTPSHILLASELAIEGRSEPAKLLLALNPEMLLNGMERNPIEGVYLELVQGEEASRALKTFGNAALKQGEPVQVSAIKGSHWQLRLWTSAATPSQNWPFLISIILVVAIFWLLRELWYNKTLRHDSATLEEQLSDLQQLTMRNYYPLINPELSYISQTIHQIGIPKRKQAPVKTESSGTEQAVDDSSPVRSEERQMPTVEERAEAPDSAEQELFDEFDSESIDNALTKDDDEAEKVVEDHIIEYDQVSPDDARQQSLKAQETAQSVRYETRPDSDMVDFNTHEETLELDDSLEPEPEQDELTLNLDADFEEESEQEPEDEEKAEAVLSAEQDVSAELTEQAEKSEKSASANTILPDQAIFRKYDIRGVVGEQLTVPVMRQLGRAVGSMLVDSGYADLNVGCDARLSSPPLTKAFIRGVLSSGCNVVDLGQVPTPLLYFANEATGVRSGAMITGSHNPTDFNGLKLVINGKALLGDDITDIYQRIKDERFTQGDGSLHQAEVFEQYLQKVQEEVKPTRQLLVVVDCGNSVAGQFLPKLLRNVGCKVIELFCDVDGRFPNHHPDPGQPTNLTALQQMVKSNKADLGIAVDGDADRLGVVDNQGKIIWPDRLLGIFAQQLLEHQNGATVLFDIKCSNLIQQIVEAAGGKALMVPAGHSVIKAEMQQTGAMLAGEMTGHFFFKDRWYGFDDAMYAACRLVELLSQSAQSSAELFATIPENASTPEIIIRLPQAGVHDIVGRFAQHYDAGSGTINEIDGVRVDFEDGWGLIRASNTMPAISLRFEASSEERLKAIKQSFQETLRELSPQSRINF